MGYPPKGQWSRPALQFTPLPTMDEYLEELKTNLRTQGYINLTRIALGHFANYCDREGITHPVEITRSHILKYQGSVVNTNANWSDSYKKQMMKLLRAYMNWLADVGHIDANPWVRIKVGSQTKKPNALTEDEVSALFAAHRRGAFSMDPFIYHRREMILAVLMSWGLRIHEVVALNNTAFDVRQNFISSINKGGGTKNLPYPEELKRIYLRWVQQRSRYGKPSDDALFIGNSGDRLSTDTIYRTVVDLGREAGVDIHPHMMRDTAGTLLLNSGMPVERVAKILGHSNIRTTLGYSEVRDKAVAEDHARAMNPHLRILFKRTGEEDGDTTDDEPKSA